MSAVAPRVRSVESRRLSGTAAEPPVVRWGLTALALGFLALFVAAPLAVVSWSALQRGVGAYIRAISDPDSVSAVRLTFLLAAIAVPLNLVFGVAAAWAIANYDFPGKSVLAALIDLPVSVSPVISGFVFVLLFGAQGWLGPWLATHQIRVIFAVPGMALATTFVTLPLVAREVLEVMQARGHHEEEAALTLGATGWQILTRVTLPKVRWGLLYGVVLCNARAMGEFGAVSVVSGHIRGRTETMPLHVEALYDQYDFVGAFSVASLLVFVALATLVLKSVAGRIVR
jgi:sulfate transport system permease protein